MQNKEDKIIAFDTLLTTHHLQMCKLLLPHMDATLQKQIAVYIKYMELQYTLSYVREHPYPVCSLFKKEPVTDPGQLCNDLSPYCTPEEKKQLEQIKQLLHTMDSAQEMAGMMDILKEFMPDMTNMDSISPDTVSEILNMFQAANF